MPFALSGYDATLQAQRVASPYVNSASVVALAADTVLGVSGALGDLLGNLVICIRTAASDVLIKDNNTTILTYKALPIGTVLVVDDIDLKSAIGAWKVQIVNAAATGSSVFANGAFT